MAEQRFPHSLGLLYSAFTYYTGFRVNSDEYKVMGLGPYGEPGYVDAIMDELIDLKEDGSFRLNMEYFDYCTGLKMTNEKFARLFGGPPREPGTEITRREMDLARSVQEVTEEIMLRMACHVHKETGMKNLCLAGGVVLNCVGNGRILREGPYNNLWIQPAAGDAGGAMGAALLGWYHYMDKERKADGINDFQKGSYLGPEFNNEVIQQYLDENNLPYRKLSDDEIPEVIAGLIAEQKVIGWFSGRMEFGPRALGSRSIIGDARNPEMQSIINLKIKFRESFRPFAPAVLEEKASEWFEINCSSPYMLLVANVKKEYRIDMTDDEKKLSGLDKLKIKRSLIPAVTHVDYSARLQTVQRSTNLRFYEMLSAFYRKCGFPVIINTSFNVRDEPIVCTPEDAYRCFIKTRMDYLVMGNFLLDKKKQPEIVEDYKRKRKFSPVDKKEVRNFGLIVGAIFLFIGILFFLRQKDYWNYLMGFGSTLVLLGVIAPGILGPFYRGWMAGAKYIGIMVTFVVLYLVFYLIVTPTGFLFRLFNPDPLRLKFDKSAKTYWMKREDYSREPSRYRHQF